MLIGEIGAESLGRRPFTGSITGITVVRSSKFAPTDCEMARTCAVVRNIMPSLPAAKACRSWVAVPDEARLGMRPSLTMRSSSFSAARPSGPAKATERSSAESMRPPKP